MRDAQKKTWPELRKRWTEFDTRDQVVDYIVAMQEKTGISLKRLVGWLGVSMSKFRDWINRHGMANEHNAKVPRDWWLEEAEKQAICDFYIASPREGYRRLTYMMIDADIVACAPTTVYRVLTEAGLLAKSTAKASKKGTGYVQPTHPHQEWHTDITYLNLGGTFYYLSSVLDGYSRYIVHWEIRESMKERDVEMLFLRALESLPGVTPSRVISDNGPQYIARDFKEFIRQIASSHVRTSPYYPQSNGKQERVQGTIKRECIRERNPQCLEDAQRYVAEYVRCCVSRSLTPPP